MRVALNNLKSGKNSVANNPDSANRRNLPMATTQLGYRGVNGKYQTNNIYSPPEFGRGTNGKAIH